MDTLWTPLAAWWSPRHYVAAKAERSEKWPVLRCPIKSRSFWELICRELIEKEIGQWLVLNGKIPCVKRHSPKLLMEEIAGNESSVRLSGAM